MSTDEIVKQLYQYTYGHPSIRTPFGYRYMINADTTASGCPNKLIEMYIQNRVLPLYNNTHSNAYTGRMMSYYLNLSKNIIKKSLNCHDLDQIIFTGNGCSGAVNHLIHCLNLRLHTPEETVVFISKAEHHSNHLPWVHLPITLVYVPILSNGLIDIDFLERELIKYQFYPHKIASLIATSNVTGVHQNTYQISHLIHQHHGLIFWDFAASAPYYPINIHYNDGNGEYYDAVFISPHKFFGGPGTPGLLVANRSLFKNKVPYCPAGGTVRFACPSYQSYSQDIETKETGGTPNIIGSIKVGLVFDLKNRYQSYISYWERVMTPYIQSQLVKIPNIRLINPVSNTHRQPVFSFLINQMHYNLIVVLLNDLFGIQSRGGISCCSLLAQDVLGINPRQQKMIHDQIVNNRGNPGNYGWCRVSFHYCMPMFIIEYIIQAIIFIGQHGPQFKNLYKYYPDKNTWIYCPKDCPWDDFSQLRLSLDDTVTQIPVTYLNQQILTHQMNEALSIVNRLFRQQAKPKI